MTAMMTENRTAYARRERYDSNYLTATRHRTPDHSLTSDRVLCTAPPEPLSTVPLLRHSLTHSHKAVHKPHMLIALSGPACSFTRWFSCACRSSRPSSSIAHARLFTRCAVRTRRRPWRSCLTCHAVCPRFVVHVAMSRLLARRSCLPSPSHAFVPCTLRLSHTPILVQPHPLLLRFSCPHPHCGVHRARLPWSFSVSLSLASHSVCSAGLLTAPSLTRSQSPSAPSAGRPHPRPPPRRRRRRRAACHRAA